MCDIVNGYLLDLSALGTTVPLTTREPYSKCQDSTNYQDIILCMTHWIPFLLEISHSLILNANYSNKQKRST